MQTVVNGTLATYAEIGKGSNAILFLHGWADSGKTFEMLARHIVKQDKKYKAVLLDLPGFGGTQSPKEAWGLEEYALFVKAFLNKTSIKPVAIAGHSNGGAIAINGLASGVLNSEKLILLASAGIRDPSLKVTMLKAGSVPAKIGLKLLPGKARKKVRQKLYGAVGSDYLVAEHMQDTFKRVVSSDVAEDASSLKLPVLLVYGETDDATPPSFGKRLADAIPNSKLEVIPETSHFVHQEQVYKVSELVRNFLK